jgi:hypothetical protein
MLCLQISSTQRVPLNIENISFVSIPGSHPLGPLLGSPLLTTKAKEMRNELLTVLKNTDWENLWTREADENLVLPFCPMLLLLHLMHVLTL